MRQPGGILAPWRQLLVFDLGFSYFGVFPQLFGYSHTSQNNPGVIFVTQLSSSAAWEARLSETIHHDMHVSRLRPAAAGTHYRGAARRLQHHIY